MTRIMLTLVLVCGPCLADSTITMVSQVDRAFTTSSTTLTRGGLLRVKNDDEFVHQIYVTSPSMNFESDEQEPGKTVDVTFNQVGTFEVRCHIHPRMLLRVTVK